MEEDRPDETQGLMRPEDFDSSTSGDGQSAPPGIPNPVMDQQQVNNFICYYSEALHEAREQNQQNVEIVEKLSDSNEKLRHDVTELKSQVQQLMSNMQTERREHQRLLEQAQHDSEARVRARDAEHANALEQASVELRTNLQQAHENENEKLVRNYEREGRHKEKQYKEWIKEYEAQIQNYHQQAEVERACYQSKLDEMARQINVIKTETSKKLHCPPQPSARKSLGTLRKEVFETVPGTVNTNRGGAVPSTGLSVNWDDNTLPPPSKQVHFGQWSSTPRHALLHDESDDIISGSNVSSLKPIPAPRSSRAMDHTEVAAATLNSTVHVMANEFKKLKEPKLAKLKGGYSSEANLFFQGWVKDVQAAVTDRQLTDSKAIQLVKEYTEGSARKQVDSFLDFTEHPTFQRLIKELAAVFSPCDDDASLMAEFYGRKQLAKETYDSFAEELQLLARKIINAKPSFKAEANNAMKQQFANGLKDEYHQISARNILQNKPQLTFTEFRTEMSIILRSRGKCPKTVQTNAVDSVEIKGEDEEPKPAKRRKQGGKTQGDLELNARVAAVQADNQRLKEKLERLEKLESSNLAQVLAQAVTYGKPNQSGSQEKSKFMGKPREPKLTPGTDGSLNPNIKCRYCEDTGHITKVCPRIKARDEYNAAKAAAKSAKSEN